MLVELLVTNVPPHIGPFEFPTVSPAGSVSVKPTPVSVAVIVPVQPPGLLLSPFGVEIVSPAGSVSLNPIPFSVVVLLVFPIVNVNDVEPPSGMLPTPKALLIVGGATTVMLALDVLPFP